MTILAIDTALDACSLALLRIGDDAPFVVSEPMVTGHAEVFFSLIDRLFAAAGSNAREIGRVAVTVGPGSFTGIRVGLAAARGLGLAWNVPVHGVTTLDAFAHDLLPSKRSFAVLIDARRGAFYRQLYNASGVSSEPELVSAEAPLAGLGDNVALAGPAVGHIDSQGRERLITPPHLPVSALERMVIEGQSLRLPVPLYVRDADARPQAHAALSRL